MPSPNSFRHFLYRRVVAVILIVACAGGITWISDRYVDLAMDTFWYRMQDDRTVSPDVVFVNIDEQFDRVYGYKQEDIRWPRLPPDNLALLLEKLGELKPKAVILDYAFDERHDPVGEERLLRAMKIVPTYMAYSERKEKWYADAQREDATNGVIWTGNINPSQYFLEQGIQTFFADIQGRGNVRYFPTYNYGEGPVPTVARLLQKGDRPKLPGKYDIIHYYSPGQPVPTVMGSSIIGDGAINLEGFVQGKYVFVGWNKISAYRWEPSERNWSSYGNSLTAAQMHATMLGNLLDGSWKIQLTFLEKFLVVVAATAVFGFLLSNSTLGWGTCIFTLGLLTSFVGPYVGYQHNLVGPAPLPFFVMFCLVGLLDLLRGTPTTHKRESDERCHQGATSGMSFANTDLKF